MKELYSEVMKHLEETYTGVFPLNEMRNHFETYVKIDHSKDQLETVRAITGLKGGTFDPQFQKYLHPELILSPRKRRMVEAIHKLRLLPILKFFRPILFLNPFKPGISFCAQRT